jgi:uncharacterized protein (TIGR02466 family)
MLELFPLAVARVQLQPDPLDSARLFQQVLHWRGDSIGNPLEGCAWTGDLHGVHQVHRSPDAAWLLAQLRLQVGKYLEDLGFREGGVAVHIQRSWPVVSEPGQLVGRHHHPNAHISAVYHLNGDGSGRCGALRLFNPMALNELVPGMAVGSQGPLHPDARLNAAHHDIPALAGQLLLFPARLDHGVLENSSEEVRLSIAFDLVLSAPAGPCSTEYLPTHPSLWDPLSQDGELMP